MQDDTPNTSNERDQPRCRCSQTPSEDTDMVLKYLPLSDKCFEPKRATPDSVGYHLFTPINFSLKPTQTRLIKTDLALGFPTGTYGRIAEKSGLALDYEISIKAGAIDPGYRGNIGVILKNDSKEVTFECKRGEPIAQIILEWAATPPVVRVDALPPTVRGTHGFGAQSFHAYKWCCFQPKQKSSVPSEKAPKGQPQ